MLGEKFTLNDVCKSSVDNPNNSSLAAEFGYWSIAKRQGSLIITGLFHCDVILIVRGT